MSETTKTTDKTFYSDNAKNVLDGILAQFASGDIPDVISIAMFPSSNSPCENWSLMNRITTILAGTFDARTFNQWLKVGRKVSKGAKAFYILAPILKTYSVDKEDGSDEKEKRQFISGFRALPVFRVEDTEGEPLPFETKFDEQELPLMHRAKEWGITVKALPANTSYYGFYAPDAEVIGLATPSEKTFFHELAHAAHKKVLGELKRGQNPLQEIVAELSAAALCRMVGKSSDDSTGNSYRYIERYAKELQMSAHKACMRVLSETEKVLKLILHGEAEQATSADEVEIEVNA
jgi:antirestriction protein ArdC